MIPVFRIIFITSLLLCFSCAQRTAQHLHDYNKALSYCDLLSVPHEVYDKSVYRKPEAQHRAIECSNSRSLLKDRLVSDGTLDLFRSISSGLDRKTNTVHNPEWLVRKIDNPYQLSELTYMLRHPVMAAAAADELTERIVMATGADDINLSEVLKASASLLDTEYIPSVCSGLSLPSLISIMEESYNRVRDITYSLKEEERELLFKNALEPWESDEWNRLLDISLKIDLRALLNAFSPLVSCLNKGPLNDLKIDIVSRFGESSEPILFEKETSFGKVIIGGAGTNVYSDDAALILDIGGDDVYLNNAGGTRRGMPVALVIDWEGDDSYITKEPFSQGAGLLGGGFLIDLNGKDVFYAADGSQGAGFFGAGILYHGSGSALFRSGSFSQAVGQFGTGIILNSDKDSIYECGRYGQALGLFRGAGILIDNDGNDRYMLGGTEPDFRDPQHSTVSMGQGFGKGIRPDRKTMGVSGGIGILIDKNGDDSYIADYFAQGASYYYGIGILMDSGGNDRYLAGRYAQGAGIHTAVGILLDKKGDDLYYSSYGVAQGIGHDYGVGFLEDRSGNDSYIAGILSQGAATIGGIGIILDWYGSDSYSITQNGQAYAHDESCAGIMIDLDTSGDYANSLKSRESVRIQIR